MSDLRSTLERVAEGIHPGNDAFDLLTRRRDRRHRNRRIGAAALAIVVAVGGTIGAFAAFRGSTAPTLASGRDRIALSLWPRASMLRTDQVTVDQGQEQWRLIPDRVAIRFAHEILGWDEVETRPGGPGSCGTDPLCTRVSPDELVLPLYRLGGSSETTVVRLQRLVRSSGTGIWSVTEVASPLLPLELQPGTTVTAGTKLRVHTSLPNGTRVVAGFGYSTECASTSRSLIATVHRSVIAFRVATTAAEGGSQMSTSNGSSATASCSAGVNLSQEKVHHPRLRSPVNGYVYVLHGDRDVYHQRYGDMMFTRIGGHPPGVISEVSAVPVRFVPFHQKGVVPDSGPHSPGG
jgi:hypothetical protein